MKFKAVIAAGVAVLTLAIGFGAQTPTASAAPPDQDHEYSVNLSTTVPGGNPTIVQKLALCTDQDGIPENAASGQQCVASSPAAPFFDHLRASLSWNVAPLEPIDLGRHHVPSGSRHV